MRIIIITGFLTEARGNMREDVTVGKPYRIFKDADDKIFFIDDANDKNYGADASKLFYIYDTYKRVEEE
ncbi:hypothetical protein D3C80_1096840 [compost metagenome]